VTEREKSWEVDAITRALLNQVQALGYVVSVHRMPSTLFGTGGAYIEMHAIDDRVDPPIQQIARIGLGESGDVDYRCACLLASSVGIRLKG
jgi:hypothetical protein